MTMTPKIRKLALTTHIISSVGWIGAVFAYLALVIAAFASQDPQIVHTAWISMELIGWYVIVPLAIASLLTGLVMSLGTKWGLFKHYWVIFKLILTSLATVVLLLHMPTVSLLTDGVVKMDTGHLGGLQGEHFHAGVGLLVLLVTAILSVFKPQGMTKYGQRKQREQKKISQT